MPKQQGMTEKWYAAVSKANAKRRGKELSHRHKAKLGKIRKALWRTKKYRKVVLAARRIAARKPEAKAKRKADAFRAWSGVRGKQRRKAASKRQKTYLLNRSSQAIARWSRMVSAANKRNMTRLWKSTAYRAKQLASRNNPTKVGRRIAHACKAAIALWASKSGQKLRKERKDRWNNPEYRLKMHRVFRQDKVWNKGHTKHTHPSLRKLSQRFTGRIPEQGRTIWLYIKDTVAIPMKSSYELLFAHWCNAKGIEWKYEPRWFNIGKGEWQGVSYTPDFYLPVLKAYVEVKGYFSAENCRKMRAFYRKFPHVDLYFLQYKGLTALRVLRQHIPHRKPLLRHPHGTQRVLV